MIEPKEAGRVLAQHAETLKGIEGVPARLRRDIAEAAGLVAEMMQRIKTDHQVKVDMIGALVTLARIHSGERSSRITLPKAMIEDIDLARLTIGVEPDTATGDVVLIVQEVDEATAEG